MVNLECIRLLNQWTFNWTRSPRIFQRAKKLAPSLVTLFNLGLEPSKVQLLGNKPRFYLLITKVTGILFLITDHCDRSDGEVYSQPC